MTELSDAIASRTRFEGISPQVRAAAEVNLHLSMCRAPKIEDCWRCTNELDEIRRTVAAAQSAIAPRERERVAAYLYSIIQSSEESEDGGPDGDVQEAFDAGIMYAAKAILTNWAGDTEWTSLLPEFAEEIASRSVEGSPLPSRWERVIKAAQAWRERIVDEPNLWADREDLALIDAIDALSEQPVSP